MSHTLQIHAIHSKTTIVLDKVYEQWDAFTKTMEAFSNEYESAYLKEFLIKNELIESYNKNLPLLKIPSYDVQVLITINHPSHFVYFQIVKRLSDLNIVRMFLYIPKAHQNPVSIFVWESDYNKMTKYMKDKLVRIRG